MLKIIDKKVMNEALTLKRFIDDFKNNRIIVISDNPNEREASNETYNTKEILKKYGAYWDKYNKGWTWSDRFKNKEEIFNLASKAVQEANKFLNSEIDSETNPTSFDDIGQWEKVKDFVEGIRDTLGIVKKQSGKVTLDLVNSYIDDLANDLNDKKLLDDIADFNKAVRSFILESGRYSYSFFNLFIIWLQTMGSGAKEFGSAPYWFGRGYQPKKDAKKIIILKPALGNSLYKSIKDVLDRFPRSAEEYAKESGFQISDPNKPIPKEKFYSFWVWAKKKGMVHYHVTTHFAEAYIYDNLNVEPNSGKEQINAPNPPQWYSEDEDDDYKAGIIIDALENFAKNNGISIASGKNKIGDARGASYGGHIELISNSMSISVLATLIHELAHEILHSSANKEKFGGKFYLGNQLTSEEKEIHAESVAYTVLKSYDFPIKHSINYLALWKANNEKIRGFQKIIRDVSMFLIKEIEKRVNSDEEIERAEAIDETLRRIKKLLK